MKKTVFFLIFLLSSWFVDADETKVISHPQVPLEAFFKNAKFTSMTISPDGKHIAALYDTGNSNTLAVMDVGLTKVLSQINFGEYMRIFRVLWPKNDRFIVSYQKRVGFLDNRESPSTWVAFDLDGENGRQLITPQRAYYGLVSLLPDKPNKILASKRFIYGMDTSNRFKYEGAKLFEIDIYSGKEKYLMGDAEYAGGYLSNTEGFASLAVVTQKDQIKKLIETGEALSELAYRRTEGGDWETVSMGLFGNKDDPARVRLLGFNKDNDIFYMSSDYKTPVPSVYAVNMNDFSYELIHKNDVAEVSGLNFFYHRGIEAIDVAPDYNQMVFLSEDSEMKQVITQLYASLGIDDTTSNIGISSYTDDGNKLIVTVSSDRDPGVFYLFNRGLDGSKPELRLLDVAKPEIDPNLMVDSIPFTFNARDGVELRGYYSLPKTGKGPFPMVQIIHGGPHGPRDYWGWDREVQFLANRGYAVVQVNFRGSGGYGEAFERSGYLEWGGKMIDDMTDATLWMVEQGFADKDRLCVYGGSYGGYGTLQSLVREPDLYKCGIGYVGVYSMFAMKKYGDIPTRESGRNYLDRVLGKDEEAMRAFSPALNVDKIKAELFIAHGREDVRVPMEQYEVLSKALKKINKPYISMVRDEGHGFTKDKNKYDFYRQMESFLAQHLK